MMYVIIEEQMSPITDTTAINMNNPKQTPTIVYYGISVRTKKTKTKHNPNTSQQTKEEYLWRNPAPPTPPPPPPTLTWIN